jgi:hypothetical protein
MKITIYGWSPDVERLVKGSFCLVDGMVSGQEGAARAALEPGMLAGVLVVCDRTGGGRAVGWARRAEAWWIGRPPH